MDLTQARDQAINKFNVLHSKNIECPALWVKIKFWNDGFSHITYKDNKHRRPEQEQIERFKCFLKVDTIIKKSHLYQEFMVTEENIKVRDHWVNKTIKSFVEYYWLVWIVVHNWMKSRIKVVIRWVRWKDYAEYHSVIPARNINWYRNFMWPID